MGVWTRLAGAIGSGAGALADWIGGVLSGVRDPDERRQVAFSVALIALSAKMAKADGVVTLQEIDAFRRLFAAAPAEARNAERLFNLARRDVAGYDAYAARIAALYPAGDPIFADLIDGLFAIAKADDLVHEAELGFIADVARILGIDEAAFAVIQARHVVPPDGDPYLVLGLARGMAFDDMRRHYRRLVADNHPDRLLARGVPPEFVALATDRVAAMNAAWDRVEAEHTGG